MYYCLIRIDLSSDWCNCLHNLCVFFFFDYFLLKVVGLMKSLFTLNHYCWENCMTWNECNLMFKFPKIWITFASFTVTSELLLYTLIFQIKMFQHSLSEFWHFLFWLHCPIFYRITPKTIEKLEKIHKFVHKNNYKICLVSICGNLNRCAMPSGNLPCGDILHTRH